MHAFRGGLRAYRRIIAQEQLAASKAAAPREEPAAPRESKPKRKRKFPYRKTADIEREIAQVEDGIVQAEKALADPETFRQPQKSREVQARYDELLDRRTMLYEHWEEAMELNT